MTKTDRYKRSSELDNNLQYITQNVPLSEILAQLAEEASEMSQAALKLRRAQGNENPTPVSVEDCKRALLEEWADVRLCTMALAKAGLDMGSREAQVIIESKANRWANRISENIKNQEA